MKRAIIAVIGLFLVALVALAAGIVFAPQRTEQLWTTLRLPSAVFDQIVALAPAGVASTAEIDEAGASDSAALTASGTLETEEVSIAADPGGGGRVNAVLVEQGQTVQAGQPLVAIDDALLQAQLSEADEAIAAALANRAVAQAGPRPAVIASAAAKLRQAQAAQTGARQALADAERAQENPLDLDAQIDNAAARVTLARRLIEQERARQAALAALRAGVAGDDSDQGKTQRAIYEKQEAAAAAAIAAAEQEAAGAQRSLSLLRQMRANPVALTVQARTAQEQVRLADAAVAVAEAELALASASPRTENVAMAQSQVDAAEAARALLAVQLAQNTLVSPIDGLVTVQAIEPGEIAAPGAPLLKVADLNRITLTVYVPLARIGQVQVGQTAHVRVDAFPDRVFTGAISYISPRAEFTPKNIQTPSGRAETVMAVEISLDNPDGVLKPGMPADAEILVAD